MTLRHAMPLVLAVMGLTALEARAQLLPWPGDPPRPGGPAPQASPAAPSPAMTPVPGTMPGPGMAAPMHAGPPGDPPPCFVEFTKLREETEKRGKAAKAASDRKASREEMCKLIQGYAAAEAKWVKFTKNNSASCGIPPQVAKDLAGVHARTLLVRKNVCATGPVAGPAPAAPSLSDALGTATLPAPNTTRTGSGTFDTLTGNAIAR
jgi:hypothetical protein